MNAQILFKLATCLYAISLLTVLPRYGRDFLVWFFLCPALFANAAVVVFRYHQAWPMVPMYLGAVALPLCLGCLFTLIRPKDKESATARRIILVQTLVIALAAFLFPKDYYLPFVKSQTLWAHLFFLFGVAGKACFLVSAAWAMAGLRANNQKTITTPNTALRRTMQWTVWGFAIWTLAMFTGEMWSYLGWGTPVVWEDPAITTTMATWFFYICLLHLHLTGTWSVRGRERYAAAGAGVIFVLNCIPELGPFRWPF